jgi:hypothetical protein
MAIAKLMQHHQHMYCKNFHPKTNFEAQEQSNQSHPPSSSVQITSQHGCHSFSQPFFSPGYNNQKAKL